MADTVEYEERLRHSLLDLGRRLLNGGDVDFDMFRLQQINRHLLHLERFSEIVQSISAVIVLLESVDESRANHNFDGCSATPCGLVGKPKFDIPWEQLEYMNDYDISISKIAIALRGFKEHNKETYSRIRHFSANTRRGLNRQWTRHLGRRHSEGISKRWLPQSRTLSSNPDLLK